MKYNKGLAPVLILVIVLGVLAVGGVAYFAGKSSAPKNIVSDNSNYYPPDQQDYNPPVTNTQTPLANSQTNTSNWKTYTNTQYGFEFKYPTNGYKFGADSPNYTYLFGLSEFRAKVREDVLTDDPEYLSNFHFFILTPTQSINDLPTYVRSAMDAPSGSPYKYISSQYVNINGTQWLKVRSKDDLGNEPGDYNYFIYSGGKLYWMGLAGQLRSDLEKIPSTFKFTK